ncbi:hypothetical protein FB567DRAFT_29510 [Paraphoma chrysanthemicola]|uniref:Uncharacterized protein n=1 Tax=Paraphoma chrysanthemicola TaxID=798071 RepID=A0A8K0RL73_9PLEO|nr:hypothetical protein FB567DRAFT_29510 [Paraphoma chrysanthemicola]
MEISRHLRFRTLIACLAILFGSGFAQRPTNASVCDFYAQARYGANTSETQLKWIQNVICLAFEGGTKLNNVSTEITGILRPGKFNNINIDLQQYFNGSRASTNVNNAPIGINWLDQGGTTPLAAFLAGESEKLVLAETSNQYHLFSNFFVAFARAFGCTQPPKPLPNTNGPVQLAYAHKFMNLEYHQLGYFINHIALAAAHFGVSTQDADTFRTSLNSRYNTRCAPAVSFNPSSPAMLLSLCQNPTCPLAVPVSDCAAYNNLTATGATNSNPTTVTSIATKLETPSATGATTSQTSAAAAASNSSDKLSTGGIAGVAVGGAAILLIAIIALFYFRRKRKTSSRADPEPAAPPAAAWDQQNYGGSTAHHSVVMSPKNPHESYYSNGHPPSEMGTSRYPTHASSPSSPEPALHQGQGYRPHSGRPSEAWSPPPVEIGIARGQTPAPQYAARQEEQWRGNGTPVQEQEGYGQRNGEQYGQQHVEQHGQQHGEQYSEQYSQQHGQQHWGGNR